MITATYIDLSSSTYSKCLASKAVDGTPKTTILVADIEPYALNMYSFENGSIVSSKILSEPEYDVFTWIPGDINKAIISDNSNSSQVSFIFGGLASLILEKGAYALTLEKFITVFNVVTPT